MGEGAWTESGAADRRELRDLFGRFLTGVTVVTMFDADGAPRGFTANSFTSVSLDPPLVLICIANGAGSFEALTRARRFGINILAESQRDISTRFASPGEDKFVGIAIGGPNGAAPLIAGSLGSLDCAMENVVPAGDHAVVLGRVLTFRTAPGAPLGYYRGGYVAFGLGSDVLEHRGGEAVAIGCLLEHDGRVLLCRRPGAEHWEIPALALGQGEDHRRLIPRLLEALNLKAKLSLLYSVYQEGDTPRMTMIFQGHLVEPPTLEPLSDGTELRLFAEDERPWEMLVGSSPTNVVRRFFRERRSARFGIYWETEGGGHVASLEGAPQRWVRSPGGEDH